MTATILSTGNLTLENATTAMAVSAVASPVWLPWLHDASQVAATLAPLLGVVWLTVQIVGKVQEIIRKGRDKK